jgi:hypothetical protein
MTAFENQTPLTLTFCDVSKAFDRVWIKALIYKLEKHGVRGDILELFKTYLTDRKHKVVPNNTESEVGCLYAGIPHGSVVGPIKFLIYINNIADHTDGICRFFADETSLAHTSNDQQNLQDMVSSDFSNNKKWSEHWLITFNPDKTDIMLFDNRRQGNISFKLGQTDILSVDFHKHLGIVFSFD